MQKKQGGFAIELVILFMLITFGFCMIITTCLGMLNSERKIAKQTVSIQTDLNQIGEYYLRYIEESGEQFPKGTETSFSGASYRWMDDDAKAFFLRCNQTYHFQYETDFSISRAGAAEFFKTRFVWRKLVVKSSNDNIRMVVELREKRVSDTSTEYYIQNWAVGEGLTDETVTDGGYQSDKLSTLQKLWTFVGLEIDSLEKLRTNYSWMQFFSESIDNFSEAFLKS